MAVTQATLARVDAILKDRPIVDAIQVALNKATPFAEKITQQLTLSGRKGIFPVQFGWNEGIYARADTGSFGDAVTDQPIQAFVQAKFVYAIFEISGPTMSATRDNPGAFEDALALQLENTVTGVKLEMARMILGKGDGVIAIEASRTSSTVIVVKSPFGLSTYKDSRPVRNILRRNMNIDVSSSLGSPGNHVADSSITSVVQGATSTTVTFTPAEVATSAANDFVTHAGSENLEPVGFFGAVDDGTNGSTTYLNITRSGLDGWNGVLVDATGGGSALVDLDPDNLRDTVDTIMEVSGRVPTHIVANYKQRRNIYNLYAPQIRYAPMVLPAGIRDSTLAFDDIPVIAERFFPPTHIGFANVDTWYHAIDKDVEWIQGLNGTVLHFLLTSDTFRAVLRTYRNFACLFPAANGFVYGLNE
jgi:hypothetical protein